MEASEGVAEDSLDGVVRKLFRGVSVVRLNDDVG